MATNISIPTYGFVNHILALNEGNWRRFFKPFITDSVQNGLATIAGANMTVYVSAGECRCGAVMGILDEMIALDIANGDSTYDRIDSVIVQYTYGEPYTLAVAIVQGTPSANPVPPTLTKVYDTLWQMEIAQILVPSGATSSSEFTITDKRVIYESIESIIDDNTESEERVWSSQKTREEIVSFSTEIYDSLNTKADVIKRTVSGDIVTITDGGNNLPVKELVVDIEPVQAGTGDPSPENIRPISGWTEANVWRTNGINILPYTAITKTNNLNTLTVTPTSDGFIIAFTSSSPAAYRGGNFYRYDSLASILTPGKSYVLSFTASGVTSQMAAGLRRIDNNSFIKAFNFDKDGDYTFLISYTDAEIGYLSFINNTAARYNVTYSNVILTECQSVTVDLGEERYGGTLNVTTGMMTVTDDNIASYNGETLPSTWISDRDAYAEGTIPTIGAQVVYKLASPQTVQLSSSKIQTLLGQNAIWSNTGDILNLTYRADMKTYVDEHVAEANLKTRQMMTTVTTKMVAPNNLVIGNIVIVNDDLYKVINSNIASGEAMVVGTNVEQITLTEYIQSLI